MDPRSAEANAMVPTLAGLHHMPCLLLELSNKVPAPASLGPVQHMALTGGAWISWNRCYRWYSPSRHCIKRMTCSKQANSRFESKIQDLPLTCSPLLCILHGAFQQHCSPSLQQQHNRQLCTLGSSNAQVVADPCSS